MQSTNNEVQDLARHKDDLPDGLPLHHAAHVVYPHARREGIFLADSFGHLHSPPHLAIDLQARQTPVRLGYMGAQRLEFGASDPLQSKQGLPRSLKARRNEQNIQIWTKTS